MKLSDDTVRLALSVDVVDAADPTRPRAERARRWVNAIATNHDFTASLTICLLELLVAAYAKAAGLSVEEVLAQLRQAAAESIPESAS